MKTIMQATLVAIFVGGMGIAQAQAVGDPSAWTPLVSPTQDQLNKLQSDGVNVQQDANGNYFMQNSTLHNYGEYTGVAAGSQASAGAAAAGSTAVIVAVGVGVLAVIGAVVAGSSSNGTTSTTSTTSTTK
jgi:hypothetical protein